MGACAADYDNDGWIDLYVTNVGPNVLYHNNGGKTFTDVTRAAGVGSRSFGTSCAFADVDRDGYVDLFVTNYVDARARQQHLLRRHGQRSSASTATRSTSRRCARSSTTTTATAPSPTSARRPASPSTAATASASSSATTTMTGGRISSWPTTRRRTSCTTTKAAACFKEVGAARRRGGRERRQAARRHGHRLRRLRRRRPARSVRDEPRARDAHALPQSREGTVRGRRRPRAASGSSHAAVRRLRHAVLRLRQRRRPRPRHRQRPRDEQLGPLPAGRQGGAAQAAVPQRRRRPVQGRRPLPRGRASRSKASAARWRPPTSTTTAISTCSSPTTAGPPSCCATTADRATTPCWCGWSARSSNRSAIGARVRADGGRHDAGARGQGRIELPRPERSARALRPRPGRADRSPRDSLAGRRHRGGARASPPTRS